MPIRERILLALATFAALAALWGSIVGAIWLVEFVYRTGGEAGALTVGALLIFGLCFGMTFVAGAPRWFRKGNR